MKNLSKKLLSTAIAFTLVGTTTIPTLVYATNQIEDVIANDNVNFDATIKSEHSYTANIDDEIALDIDLSVNNDGYIKDGIITIENNNYKLGNIENEDYTISKDNKISLEKLNSGEKLNLSIPLEFEKTEQMEKSYFKKDSTIKLDATYVDKDGKESDISKQVVNNLTWDANIQANIKQELKRYLKYEDKTLVSFLITSGIQDNKMPVLEKTIQMLVPKIADKEPSKIIVSGENIEYTYQDQILVINKIKDEQETINWESNDEYLVTYVYESQMDEENIDTVTVMKTKLASEREVETKAEESTFNVSEQVGSLLETTISGDNTVNKGYLYTNLVNDNKLETSFNTNYKVNIGITDLIDEIQIKENVNSTSLTKRVSVNEEELTKILGENGSIKVLDNNNQELGTLNKDTLELNINNYGLQFITSKPEQEGNLTINLEKIINPDMEYTKQSLAKMNEIDNSIDVYGIYQNNQISNNHIENKIALAEPTSNASINISQNNLSTVVTNENVVITATLEKNDISDALYTNPELLIKLPGQITGINLKEAKLLYEEQLVPAQFETNGNSIYLRLEGTQTQYTTLPNTDGAVIRIVADLTLDNLAVNSDENINLQYSNHFNNEVKEVNVPVKIVAPTGFILANQGTLNQNVSAIVEDSSLPISANSDEKKINLNGITVSNLKENVSGFMILGRIPSEGTKSVDGSNSELNANYSSKIASELRVEGLDADIYYTENGEANYDLNNEANGWSQEYKETAKSYLIVAKSEVTPAQRINFNYDIIVPRNLDYEKRATSTFAVYYDNKAENGSNKNIISSKALTIETENIPVINTQISAYDYNTGDEIKAGDEINQGRLVKYVIHATNTGRKTAENIKVTVQRPDAGIFYIVEYLEDAQVYNNYYDNSIELSTEVERIEPGETKDVEFLVKVNGSSLEDGSTTFRAEVTAENMLENSTASFENKVINGILDLNLSTTDANEEVRIDEEINYSLVIDKQVTDTLNNVVAKVNIPKYIELTNYEGGNFNEETRELTYELGTLEEERTYNFTAKVTNSEEPNQEINVTARATYDGQEKEVKASTVKKVIIDTKGFEATFSSNIVGRMSDTDTVEYYINVTNGSKRTAPISIYEVLDEQLKLTSYTVINGNNGYTVEDVPANFAITEMVQAGENIRITLVAKPYMLDSLKEIESSVGIKVNDIDLPVNTIKQEIQGTLASEEVVTENSEEYNTNAHNISGKVWYDENANSKQDENYVGMPGIPMKLYDVNKKEYVKAEDGKDLEIYTNDNGEYKFEGLENGQYIIMANYDNEAYKISNYQEEGLTQSEDNDFIQSKTGEATTNIIYVNNENVYNIDLGLVDIENFNIVINNKISKKNVINKDKTESYEISSENANLKIRDIENSRIVVEYIIEVANEGNIDGYVTRVVNHIPEGMTFMSELNQDWYVDEKGNAINTSIANKLIKSGEKQELKLILIKNNLVEDGELVHAEAKIEETYNQYGIEEITSTQLEGISAGVADIVITHSSNTAIEILGISVSILAIIGLVGAVTYKYLNKDIKNMPTI